MMCCSGLFTICICQVCKALDQYRCPPKVPGRCLVIDATSNRIKQAYFPEHEARDDLEVLTTALTRGAEQEQEGGGQQQEGGQEEGGGGQQGRGEAPPARATTSNRILHRQKSEMGEAAAEAAGLTSTAKSRRKGTKQKQNNQNDDGIMPHFGSPGGGKTALKGGRGGKHKRGKGERRLGGTEQLRSLALHSTDDNKNDNISTLYSKTM